LSIAVLTIWVYLLVARGGFWRMREEGVPKARNSAARIVAIIPARDEAEVVGAAVESLAKQRFSSEMHIVVVNDHSADDTADRARAAVRSGMLSVISAGPLPAGWSGKLWAVAEGVRFAARFDPDYLLLTDADIVHGPDKLAELAARVESGYDM